MKKFLSLLMAVTMIATLAGCGAKKEEAPAAEEAADGQITLRMFDTLASESRTAAITEIIAKYEELNPNVTIELITPPTDGADQKLQQMLILEKLHIPVQRKAFKSGDVLSCIERSHDQNEHGDIQEDENQSCKGTAGLFHPMMPPSSSAPKRFMMPVQTNTRIISTKLRAAPRLGLLPCLN